MEAKFVTDINQSRELSEFLALESADFGWDIFSDGSTRLLPIDDWDLVKDGWGNVEFIPAWSLSALFKLLPIFTEPTAFSVNVSVPSVTKTDNGWLLKYDGDFTLNMNNGKDTEAPVELLAENPIDAAFEMICWLKENGKI